MREIKNLVHWNIVLASSFELSEFNELLTNSKWRNILPDLLQDFNILLSDALDLMSELGGANHEAEIVLPQSTIDFCSSAKIEIFSIGQP